MVKSTKCCYKRWLWTFGALTELDVVVANINIQLTAFALISTIPGSNSNC